MRQRNDTLTAARNRLESKQARFTPARRLVIETLDGSSGPQSAADLAVAVAGAIPMSSLYRTLSVLEETEVIERFPDQAGIARYELAEWLTGHHHHMTCIECGATSDVAVPGDLEATVADIASEVGRRFDFTVTGHRLDLQGVCSQCR
ncbi:MAG: transcriptional repressor [Acidimicrobiia bacterium]|nr:transcriptional repressor [Acidimicrobiia bacterium]MDH3397978.1 transcriptional repressor [Acidimicrobiia bacterium]MDH5615003.1 transcriptional repressor [Acidimicrobiia bacterium]